MTLATLKQDIIKQYNRLLNKRYISALNILLSPCCELSGTGVAVCTDINTFTLTITLDGSVPSFPVPFGIIVNPQIAPITLGTYTAPNTITATVVFTSTGAGVVTDTTQDVGISLVYPTSYDGSIAVTHSFMIPNVHFDGNPCD